MALKRTGALCMAILTAFLMLACIHSFPAVSGRAQEPEGSLPLSLATPVGGGAYFLPPYDEVSSFTPSKKLYILPTVDEPCEIREFLSQSVVYEAVGLFGAVHTSESITPRAP